MVVVVFAAAAIMVQSTQKSPQLELRALHATGVSDGGFALGALHLSRLHAAGADTGLAYMAILVLDGDLLHIGLEYPVGDTVGMAHVVSE